MQVPEQAKTPLSENSAVIKMSINEVHHCLGHTAIEHAIAKGLITGIDLNESSRPDFCEACVKAKSARQPFPQESETQAEKYREYVHWDLYVATLRSPKCRPGREGFEVTERVVWIETSRSWLVHGNELSVDKGVRLCSFSG